MDAFDLLAQSVDKLDSKLVTEVEKVETISKELNFIKGQIKTMWFILLSIFGTIVGVVVKTFIM